jgi:hypothetical protein
MDPLTPGLYLVPVSVAYVCIGIGLIAGMFVTHLIWMLGHQPAEDEGKVLRGRWRKPPQERAS